MEQVLHIEHLKTHFQEIYYQCTFSVSIGKHKNFILYMMKCKILILFKVNDMSKKMANTTLYN